jgi:Ca2+-binding EF-hand superfamily protein
MPCRSSSSELPYNVDYSFSKLLEKEVDLARNVIYALQEIKCRYDFNIHNIFHSVKSFNSITPGSIRIFFGKNEITYLESDIKAIIKKLDLNKDGRIDLCEFHALLGFPNCAFCCPCVSCNICGTRYCDSCFTEYPCYLHENSNNVNFNENMNNNSSKMNSIKNSNLKSSDNDINNYTMPPQKNMHLSKPLYNNNKFSNSYNLNEANNNDYDIKGEQKVSKSLSIRASPERKYAPYEIDLCDKCNKIPCICGSINQNTKENHLKNSQTNINKNNIIQNNSDINDFEKNQFNDFLKLLMNAEKVIEQKKIDLALYREFNCEDAFRIFEKNGRGFLTKDDLKYGLYLLGINASDFIIDLLFKRFDLQKLDEISYPDFFDMLIPFEKKFRNDVEQRPPRSFSIFQNIEIFSQKTIICLRNVFNLIIEYENKINEMRKSFSILVRRLKDIFRMFDLNGLGFFNFQDFIRYLKDNELLDESLNADLLFIRLDKNRNGKIDFTEVADEIEALY